MGPKEEWSLAASQISSTCQTHFHIPVTVYTEWGEEIVVSALVDSGAEKSFVDDKFVATFQLRTKKVKNPMQVRLADGSLSQTGIIDKSISLTLLSGDHHFEELSLKVMSIGGSTLILGLDWLKKHSPTINFEELSIDFNSTHCKGSV